MQTIFLSNTSGPTPNVANPRGHTITSAGRGENRTFALISVEHLVDS
jgi:hypothetical protein